MFCYLLCALIRFDELRNIQMNFKEILWSCITGLDQGEVDYLLTCFTHSCPQSGACNSMVAVCYIWFAISCYQIWLFTNGSSYVWNIPSIWIAKLRFTNDDNLSYHRHFSLLGKKLITTINTNTETTKRTTVVKMVHSVPSNSTDYLKHVPSSETGKYLI